MFEGTELGSLMSGPGMSRLGGIRWISCVAIVALCLLLPRVALAMLLPHEDINSLAFESDAIVRFSKVSERSVAPYTKVTTVRIEKVYAGSGLTPGQLVDLSLDSYRFEPMWGWPDKPPHVSSEIIGFLERSGEATLRVLPSGLRIFVDGRAFRFAQESNPGLYGPIPGEGKGQYDLVAFEQLLSRAMTRAVAVRRALASVPSATRTEELLAFLPRHGEPEDRDIDFGHDQVGAAIFAAILADSSDAAFLRALDVRARAPRLEPSSLNAALSLERLVAAALDARLERHRRIAAIRLIRQQWFELSNAPDQGKRLAALFSDRDPHVRSAATTLSFADGKAPPAILAAVVARFPNETDPNVRFDLYVFAEALHIAEKLAVDQPLVKAERLHDVATVSWTRTPTGTAPTEIILVLRSNDGSVHREDATKRVLSTSTSASEGSTSISLLPELPAAPGVYHVEVRMKAEDTSKAPMALIFDETLPLGELTVPTESAETTAASTAPSQQPPPQSVAARATPSKGWDTATSIALGIGLTIALELLRRVARRRR